LVSDLDNIYCTSCSLISKSDQVRALKKLVHQAELLLKCNHIKNSYQVIHQTADQQQQNSTYSGQSSGFCRFSHSDFYTLHNRDISVLYG